MLKPSTQTMAPTATLTSIILILTVSTTLLIGAGCVETGENSQAYNITWTGTQPHDHTTIETHISRQITPYQDVTYDNVTILKSE
ncbi:MAG: hypothetical protein EF813_04520, partial [Methanosarcinales archaeon]